MAFYIWIHLWNNIWNRYYISMETIMEKNKKIFTYCLAAMIAGFILSNVAGCTVTSKTAFRGQDSKLTIGTGVGVDASGEVIYESN